MQNQAAVEALYSATYVEDFLDTVDHLPNELQRNLSRLREYDLALQRELLHDLESLVCAFEAETSVTAQRNVLAKIQKGLIAAQDIGDDKMATVQAIVDLVESRVRMLEQDARNLDFDGSDDDDSNNGRGKANHNASQNLNSSAGVTPSSGNQGSGSASTKSAKHKVSDDKADNKALKRRKKPGEKQSSGLSSRDDRHDDGDDDDSNVSRSSSAKQSRGGAATNSTSSGRRLAKEPKRATKPGKKSNSNDRDDSDKDIDLSSIEIDPDEPTYCLCDQVSYGDMIGCDNDLCPIEWFHFSCVQLSTKPKGKWYCPKCRGDKPTIMKPKAQFLKELEKFNKEREEKMSKQSN